jgi:hypothetical protein
VWHSTHSEHYRRDQRNAQVGDTLRHEAERREFAVLQKKRAEQQRLATILNHARAFWAFHRDVRSKRQMITRAVVQEIITRDKQGDKAAEAMEKERMRLLMAEDEEGCVLPLFSLFSPMFIRTVWLVFLLSSQESQRVWYEIMNLSPSSLRYPLVGSPVPLPPNHSRVDMLAVPWAHTTHTTNAYLSP